MAATKPARNHLPWLFAASFCFLSCGGRGHSVFSFRMRGAREHESYCARAVMGRTSPYRMPLADPAVDDESLQLLAILPPEARRTARAAGLEPLIVSLLRGKASDDPASAAQLMLHAELSLRLQAFDAQASSLAFETACTRRRVEELLSDLDADEQNRQISLAAGSLVVGATTSTMAGVWDLHGAHSDVPRWTAVAGGVVTAALGAASLLVPERPVSLEHGQNLLRPIIRGQDPEHLYASFVFRMLAARYPGDDTTPRDRMLTDFEQTIRRRIPVKQRAEALDILAGDGAVYSRDMLETREDCLRVLELAVAGVSRDLELLDRTMVRLFATHAVARPLNWP